MQGSQERHVFIYILNGLSGTNINLEKIVWKTYKSNAHMPKTNILQIFNIIQYFYGFLLQVYNSNQTSYQGNQQNRTGNQD